MTNMTTNKLIRQLQRLRKSVLEDGEIDWAETEQLRKAIRPLSVRRGYIFEDYEQLLMKCRKDRVITPEESRILALQLDFICSVIANRRLKFLLTIAMVVLTLVCTFVLTFRIVASTDTSALREPTAGKLPDLTS